MSKKRVANCVIRSYLYSFMRDMNNNQAEVDYRRIESAIHYIDQHRNGQPSLEEIAAHVNMSPYHFQRLFTKWAGISPKKFLQFLTLRYAKEQLREEHSLAEIAHEVGLSGSSRLHDLFITMEGMTPGQYRRSGKGITIYYGFHFSPFGKYMLAVTSRQRICTLEFSDHEEESVAELENRWSESTIIRDRGFTAAIADRLFDLRSTTHFCLLVKGTPFQLKVWEALLKIPFGSLVSYQAVSEYVDNPRGLQATGNAIGKNPIAYLIPCHRVVRKTGELNGYRWGMERKSALIGWEAAHL